MAVGPSIEVNGEMQLIIFKNDKKLVFLNTLLVCNSTEVSVVNIVNKNNIVLLVEN